MKTDVKYNFSIELDYSEKRDLEIQLELLLDIVKDVDLGLQINDTIIEAVEKINKLFSYELNINNED